MALLEAAFGRLLFFGMSQSAYAGLDELSALQAQAGAPDRRRAPRELKETDPVE
jgi:hypothetical protein